MPITDPRQQLGDADADALVADVRTTDPAANTPGLVVRIAGAAGGAPPAGSATEAKQDEQITNQDEQTALLISIDGHVAAIEGSASSIDGKIPADPATETKQDAGNALLTTIDADTSNLVTHQTDGTQQTIIRGGAKGATVAATVTSTANGADHQGADVVEQFAPAYEAGILGRAVTIVGPISAGDYAHTSTTFSGVHKGTIAASEANLLSFTPSNVSGAGLWLSIYDKGADPIDGAETATRLHFSYIPTGAAQPQIIPRGTGLHGLLGLAFYYSTSPSTNAAPLLATNIGLSTEHK